MVVFGLVGLLFAFFGIGDQTLARMTATTAVLAIVAGAAALTTVRAAPAHRVALGGKICAGVVVTVAGLSTLDSLLDIGFAFDRVMQSALSEFPAGEPSMQTSLAFTVLGAALLFVRRRPRVRRIADWLAVLAIAIATFALLGYLFGVPWLYGAGDDVLPPRTYMSVPTAVAVIVLGLTVLTTQIEHSLIAVVAADDAGGVAARRLFGGLLVLLIGSIGLIIGERLYSTPVGDALIVLTVLGPGSALILSTARLLSRADSALRSSEGRLRLLFEKASDAIFLADLDGRYTEVNEAACRLLGYTADQIIGKTIVDFVPAEDVPRLAASRERMMHGGVDVGEWMLRRSDGHYLPVEVSARIFPDGRWEGIARDITARKEAEGALVRAAQSERTLRTDLEALLEAVSGTLGDMPRTNIDSVLRAIAENARVAVGAAYSAIALGGSADRVFDHWVAAGVRDDLERIVGRLPRPVGVLGEVLRRGEPVRYADVTKAPLFRGMPVGHPAVTSFLAVPIKHHGHVVGAVYLGNKHDAREFTNEDVDVVAALAGRVAPALQMATQYAAEQTMRTRLRTIIEQLPEGVIVVDEHGVVTATNQAMLAFAIPDATGRDPYGNRMMFDVRTPDRKPVPIEDLPLSRALRDGTITREGEFLLRQADDRMIPIVASACPLRDSLGRITGAVVVVTEISERKELERLREEWIAVIAHDLRQPLNSILLWSDRVASLASDPAHMAAVERIRNGAWRLNRMIQDLLDAARIAAMRLDIDPHASDLIAAVKLAIETTRDHNPDEIVELTASAHELAWFDNDRVQQVLANLLSNAVKYGATGAPIHVGVKGDDAFVEVSVTSRGAPLAAEERALMFSRFARTKAARESGVPGIGLGLYITKGLVEAHGGKIWIESDETGNSFKFTLPRPPER